MGLRASRVWGLGLLGQCLQGFEVLGLQELYEEL